MTDIINEIMDFFLSLLVDKSIQGINKCNLKKNSEFLDNLCNQYFFIRFTWIVVLYGWRILCSYFCMGSYGCIYNNSF